MPVHIGEEYDEIRGPYSFTLLKPIHEPDITFLFLGETHNFTNWEPCDRPRCADVQTDFMKSLDHLAKEYPIEFYIEKFVESKKELTELSRFDIQLLDRRADIIKSAIRTPKETKQKKYPSSHLTKEVISPMVETAYLYRSCINPVATRVCELPHLRWNYTDARQENVFTYSSLISNLPLYQDIIHTLYNYQKGKRGLKNPIKTGLLQKDLKDDVEWEDDFKGGVTVDVLMRLIKCANATLQQKESMRKSAKKTTLHENLFYAYLEMKLNILTESNEDLVRRVMTQPYSVLFEQYRDMPKQLRLLFTGESFVKLQMYYKRMFPNKEREIHDVMDLLRLLMEFTEKADSRDPRLAEIADEINDMDVNDLSFINNIFTYYTAIVLDMYFLFRAYKRGKERKLVVGYLGGAHVKSLVYYLTRVVKTHRIEYQTHGEGRVRIDPDIFLVNRPEDIGKRPKRAVSRAKHAKHGKNVTRRVSRV